RCRPASRRHPGPAPAFHRAPSRHSPIRDAAGTSNGPLMSTRPPASHRARAALAVTALLDGTVLAALPAGTASAADGDLAVQYRTSATGAVADQSEPWLKVRNTGSTTVPLSQVRIRYYFTADAHDAAYRLACSRAVRGCSAVTGTIGTPAHPTATADRYLEIGFTAAAGSLAPGADTGDMQL